MIRSLMLLILFFALSNSLASEKVKFELGLYKVCSNKYMLSRAKSIAQFEANFNNQLSEKENFQVEENGHESLTASNADKILSGNKMGASIRWLLFLGAAILFLTGVVGYKLIKRIEVKTIKIEELRKEKLVLLARKIELEKNAGVKNIELRNQSLEITTYKNLLIRLKKNLESSSAKSMSIPKEELSNMAKMIHQITEEDSQWLNFQKQFSSVLPEFFTVLSKEHPELTKHEIRICAYIRMDLTNSEVAKLLNISKNSLIKARYRLKKKMNLPKEMSVDEAIKNLA